CRRRPARYLPESVVAAIRAAEVATAQYNSTTLTIAAAYGGREEIVDAVCSFHEAQAKQGASLSDVIENMTSDAIARHLYAADLPDSDLIIRTSGEIRLSGFLLWQSLHSEFYFTDVLWPAFRKIDFLRAIRAYQGRNAALAADSMKDTQTARAVRRSRTTTEEGKKINCWLELCSHTSASGEEVRVSLCQTFRQTGF
ncbi:MAG: polyprenyl diphosphate synthase, partial [Pseudolabrys sp.]